MTDRFTKSVLTVIAVCLVYIVTRDVTLIQPASAKVMKAAPGDDVIHVIIDGVVPGAYTAPVPVICVNCTR